MSDLTLITLTSDRPVAFQLCETWMKRAIHNYAGSVAWYVIDDGVQPATCSMGQTHLRREPGDSPIRSFLGNLMLALEVAAGEKILFIEDDDWYAPDYLTTYASWLDQAEIVGEARAKYYCARNRYYRIWQNTSHASLCQTGIRRGLVAWLSECVAHLDSPLVDLALWQQARAYHAWRLESDSTHCVGMKCLPGKQGITVCPDRITDWDARDASGELLRDWIGSKDAACYEAFFHESLAESK